MGLRPFRKSLVNGATATLGPFPRSLKMATSFALLDGEPLLMELDSSHLAEVRFLGNALPAPTTRNIKPARTRRESVRAPYQEDGMHIQLECSDSLFGAFAGAANRE
jgi:hypothetical protein